MGLFNKQRQTKLETKIVAPPETKRADETPPTAMRMRYCAMCDKVGARHRIPDIGYWYLPGKLPNVYLCDDCNSLAMDTKNRHHTSQKKTKIETPAVKPKESA